MTPTPQQLIDALTANGFTARNEGEDAFGPRGWTVWYPQRIDPTIRITAAPHTVGHALAELARAADTGRRATAVLGSLGGQQPAGPQAIDSLTNAQKSDLWNGAWEAYKTQYWAFRDANPGWQAFFTDHHGSALDAGLQYALEQFAKVKSSADEEQNDTSSCPAPDSGPTPRAQSSGPQPVTVFHAWSVDDTIPDVNELYADLEHAKASTIEAFLDSEVGSEDDPEVHAERAKEAARLGWVQKHSTWELIYTDTPGMAGWTDVCIGERRVHAKPATAGLDLSPAVERITAIAPGVDPGSDTWLPAGLVDRDTARHPHAGVDRCGLLGPALGLFCHLRPGHLGGHRGVDPVEGEERTWPAVDRDAIGGWAHAGGVPEPADPIAILDAAIAASGGRLTFDPRHVIVPHTHRGPKATDPDREHPAHDGQTCEEYEAVEPKPEASRG